MAAATSLPALLSTLTASLSSAIESAPESNSIVPPKDANSLLNVKNELLLSYLENLVFLIILKLRKHHGSAPIEEGNNLDDAVVKKLVELQVYLEKGVRPLEAGLKYQIDKVLRAADDAARASVPTPKITAKKSITAPRDDEETDSDDSDDDNSEHSDGPDMKESEIDELQYRPNPSAFVRPTISTTETANSQGKDGVYRPPRIAATTMPTTNPREKAERRAQKSSTLDEFINTELSEAPIAEPSIGLTTVSGGRRTKSAREKKEEDERRDYEEQNYVRLPKETKKERAKKGGRQDVGYGGEEWRGLGEGVDRIERLVNSKNREGRSELEKSRKRSATEDGPKQGGGLEVGQGFQKRVKTMDGVRRDRGRGRK